VPTVYPGAPEPTSFSDRDAGNVAVVFMTQRRRVRLEKERVARWYWETCPIGGLEDLRRLAARTDLSQRVLQITIEASLPAAEYEEAERILLELSGTEAVRPKVGILQLDRSGLELDTRDIEAVFANMPESIRETVRRLKEEEPGERGDIARRALYHLDTLARKVA